MKYLGLSVFILTTSAMIGVVIYLIDQPSGFGPKYETVEINQNIGGKLLCQSVYNADIHSWRFEIQYKYINTKGDTLNFGFGEYDGREWLKNEQIKKFNNILVLKTGDDQGATKLIIKDIRSDSIMTYVINTRMIEQDRLWQELKNKSLLKYCCSEIFIDKIQANRISITYKFKKIEKNEFKSAKRKILFEINNETGEVELRQVY